MSATKTPLAILRKRAGYTQAEFAPLVGQGLRSYQRIESATTRLPFGVAEHAARLIGVRLGRHVDPMIELYTGRVVHGPAPQAPAPKASRATSTGYRGPWALRSRRATPAVQPGPQRPPAPAAPPAGDAAGEEAA